MKIADKFAALKVSTAALENANTTQRVTSRALYAEVAPIVRRHKLEVEPLFIANRCQGIYEKRYGSTYSGDFTDFVITPKYLELWTSGWCGDERQRERFLVPVTYLKGNPDEHLDRAIEHYQKAFARLARLRKFRADIKKRAEDLQDLARLVDVFKNDPAVAAALSAVVHNP